MRGRGTPYYGLYGEVPPEWGIFFRRRLYEGVGISLAEVNERIEKCDILIGENYGFEKFKNTLNLVLSFIHILKAVHSWQLKGMQSSKLGVRKGYHLSIEGIPKGTFSVKNGM